MVLVLAVMCIWLMLRPTSIFQFDVHKGPMMPKYKKQCCYASIIDRNLTTFSF